MAVVVLALVLGLVGLAMLERFRPAVEGWLERAITGWMAHPERGGLTVFALSTPLWLFAWYIGRIARRVAAAERWPPPGQPVVRDTPVLSGRDARHRARLLHLAAALSWLLPIVSGLLFWRMLNVIAR